MKQVFVCVVRSQHSIAHTPLWKMTPKKSSSRRAARRMPMSKSHLFMGRHMVHVFFWHKLNCFGWRPESRFLKLWIPVFFMFILLTFIVGVIKKNKKKTGVHHSLDMRQESKNTRSLFAFIHVTSRNSVCTFIYQFRDKKLWVSSNFVASAAMSFIQASLKFLVLSEHNSVWHFQTSLQAASVRGC